MDKKQTNKKLMIYLAIALGVGVALAAFFILPKRANNITEPGTTDDIDVIEPVEDKDNKTGEVIEAPEGFCGQSTLGACASDSDCVTDGCSGQVCRAKKEGSATTTCEFRECYKPELYNLGCGCLGKKCQWGSADQGSSK